MERGFHVGLWSGLVSGLIACLMGLLLIVVWMSFLLHDPSMIREYAQLGPASGAPGLASYVAYQTLTGTLLHLIVLGLGMGVVLGILGGAVGKGMSTFQKRE